jgi:hypothetical protein
MVGVLFVGIALSFNVGPAVARADNGLLNLYVNSWYKSPWSAWFVSNLPGQCKSLANSTMDNAVTSVYNWVEYDVVIYPTYNCSGYGLVIGDKRGNPDLPPAFDNNMSSFNRF